MKKSSVLFNFFTAILFNIVAGGLFASALGVPPHIGSITLVGVGVAQNIIRHKFNVALPENALYAGLNREVWLNEIIQQFRPDTSWLKELRDFSMYVNNNTLNLAEAGLDPQLIYDYDGSFPIPLAQGTEDTPIALALRTVSTERERLLNSAQAERSYAIRSDRTSRHARAMEVGLMNLIAHTIAPPSDSANTPVISTTGAAFSGFKNAKLEDVVDLETRLNAINATGRKIFVMDTNHLGHFKKQDLSLFKSFTPEQLVQGFPFLGFTAYVTNMNLRYNPTNMTKNALGSSNPGAAVASFAFVEGEAVKAFGSMTAFTKEADPEFQADEINFSKRFLGLPLRGVGLAALVSSAA